jgi:hypothetical protein
MSKLQPEGVMSRCYSLLNAFVASIVLAGCADVLPAPTSPNVAGARAARSMPTPTDVTTTIYDTDAAGVPLLTRSDAYNGAGSATYAPLNKVTSVITADGGSWQLFLGGQTARRVYLVLAGQGIPLPDGYYSTNVEAYSQCFGQGDVPVSLLAMTAGSTNGNCSFGVDFSASGSKYKLVMSPKFAGTGRALVSCMQALSGACTRWTIAPNASVANVGLANLFRFASNGSLVLVGVYRNSYSVVAAR